MSFETQEAVVSELWQYTVNERVLHRLHQAIIKQLAAKKARGVYKRDLAVKGFAPLVEAGAKKYAKEFGSPNQPWHKMFDVPTRKAVAGELTDSFEAEYGLGNYDNLLPKKYQKPQEPWVRVEGMTSPMPASEAKKYTGRVKTKASASHARKKKVSWKAPESLKIAWSPVNQAWLALWPGRGRIEDQQVLKMANTDGMHSWLRETYGERYGSVGAPRAHSTMLSAHARKKSKSQLDREIANVVPAWRGGR